MKGAFVSYARADGENFAMDLASKLEEEGFDVWMDRLDMVGGRDWWHQIVDAIDSAPYLLLVMTPAAVASPTTTREWRYARGVGVCVVPIAALDDLNWDDVPRWMKAKHFYDTGKEWAALTALLAAPCEVDRVPFMAPALPARTITRRREIAQISSQVLAAADDNRKGYTIALLGPGGYGKSTLAIATCHDEDLLTEFDDGVFWVSLGRSADVLGELNRIYRAASGRDLATVRADDAAREVAGVLRAKRALLVVDDAWQRIDTRWFILPDSTCVTVVTTRNFDVAADCTVSADDVIRVNAFSAEESLELLTKDMAIDQLDVTSFGSLAEQLGWWPLVLDLTRSALRSRLDRGASVDEAVRYVRDAVGRGGVEAFDVGNPVDRNDAARLSLDLSLELLSVDDADRWAELAIFPDKSAIPLRSLGQLWGLDTFATEEVAVRLDSHSLIRLDLSDESVDVHHVLLDLARERVSDIAALHRRLVTGWGDLRALAPSDSYAWAWVGHHLLQAGEVGMLRELLLDAHWVRQRLAVVDAHSLVEDYRRFDADLEMQQIGEAMALSGHVLNRDAAQLAGQLHGRLDRKSSSGIAGLLEGAGTGGPSWLRPRQTSLITPGQPLMRTVRSLNGAVLTAATSSDGRYLITASAPESEYEADETEPVVTVWDLVTGTQLAHLKGHDGVVRALAVTPDSRRVVSGSADGTIRVWDLGTGAEAGLLPGHDDEVWCLVPSPDGRHLFSGADDGTIRIWSLDGCEELQQLNGHDGAVLALALSTDGDRLISGSADETVRIWDPRTGDELKKIQGHDGGVWGVTITQDGRRIISASDDGTARVWDSDTGEQTQVFTGHTDEVWNVAVLPDGRVVSAGVDGSIRVWDIDSGELSGIISGHTGAVWDLDVLPDHRSVLTCSSDETVRVWDIDAARLEAKPAINRYGLNALAVSPDGRWIVSGSDDETVRVRNGKSGKEILTLSGHDGAVRCVAVSPDGRWIVSGSDDETVRVWECKSGRQIRVFSRHDGAVRCVAVSPDSRWIVSGSDDQTVRVWKRKSGKQKRKLEHLWVEDRYHKLLDAIDSEWPGLASQIDHTSPGAATALVLAPNGKHCLTATQPTGAIVWDVRDGERLHELGDEDGPISAVAVTPNGRRYITGAANGEIAAWDAESGKMVVALEGHSGPVSDLTVTPGGSLLLSVGGDGEFKIWNLKTRSAIATFSADYALHAVGALSETGYVACGALGSFHLLDLKHKNARSSS